MKKSRILSLMLAGLMLVGCQSKKAEDKKEEKQVETTKNFEGKTLNVVATSEKYKKLFDKFSDETKAKVEFLSMSSGEVIAKIKAEGGKPSADVWFGGGIDAFMKAKSDGLLEMYKPEGFDKIKEGFKDNEGYWISKGVTVVGFLVNNKILEEKGLKVPKTWEEIVDPKYKDEIIMANPAVSGTSFANVKGLIDKYGEEKAWEYFKKLNDNVKFYGKRGKDPQEKTVAGEFGIGIIPIDKSAFDVAEKNNLTAIYPEDGLCWVPEGVAIFKNSPNLEVAKAFEDFILRPENQQLIAELDGKDGGQMVIEGTKGYDLGLPKDKFIKEDIESFGSQREAILKKWAELTQGK
ncbi:ABC transporter substrate-binding protein [Parvimonas micra]|uniref:ABC transporter substrate-binding protein n=1 Tax=Parvimonas TaxID=543311 RepID=UPI00020DDAAD|nr:MULTISPECIES: ABC transporter substrate-binding protein [unclassified Parvimonas]EGL38453.1 ABC transporter, solute-binding protein [Parvimonas sp. oral taxon 110 str. F0139]MEB3011658.1 ABC transporter substrate-binding protein [Parvimonas sp. D2]MEB3087150.1 ABC transporter substrate-binding protein [Parvimonas sp. D4]